MLRVAVASRQFQNFDDLMTNIANGGCARFRGYWLSGPWQCEPIDAHGRILHGCYLPLEYGTSLVGTLFSQIN